MDGQPARGLLAPPCRRVNGFRPAIAGWALHRRRTRTGTARTWAAAAFQRRPSGRRAQDVDRRLTLRRWIDPEPSGLIDAYSQRRHQPPASGAPGDPPSTLLQRNAEWTAIRADATGHPRRSRHFAVPTDGSGWRVLAADASPPATGERPDQPGIRRRSRPLPREQPFSSRRADPSLRLDRLNDRSTRRASPLSGAPSATRQGPKEPLHRSPFSPLERVPAAAAPPRLRHRRDPP